MDKNKFKYFFGLSERKFSLAVRLIDSYSGKPITKGIYVRIKGANPVIKQDGHFVFMDLDSLPGEINTGGDVYFTDTVTLSEISDKKKEPLVIKIKMIPTQRYPMQSGAAYVLKSGMSAHAHKKFFCIPKPGIIPNNPSKINPAERMLAIVKGKKIQEININELNNDTMEVLPVSIGRVDEDGCLFIPLWGINEGIVKAVLYADNNQYFEELNIERYK
jgi:hypothetical protein